MKIDLHCHTKAVRSGEPSTRNVTPEIFLNKVENSGLKILAITNHDIFDEQQFNELQQATGNACSLWPGVELNVTDAHGAYHLIVIVSPKKITDFSDNLAKLTAGKTGDFNLNVEDVVEAFDLIDAIFLPHFGNKKPAISKSGLEQLTGLLKNKSRLIFEDSNSRSTGILASHGMNTITGSDVRDWALYHESDLSELRLPIDSFEQFCMFLDRDPTVIKCLLDKNNPVKYISQPSKEDPTVLVPISLYREVNVIFGDKGTGKSQILASVQKKMEANSVSVAAYISSEKDTEMESLLESSDMQRTSEKIGIDDCLHEFNHIKQWGDCEPTPLQSYVDYIESKHAGNNKDRIKWVEMQATIFDERKLADTNRDLESVNDAIDVINDIREKYLAEDEVVELDRSLIALRDSVGAANYQHLIEKHSSRLLHHSLEKIRTLVTMKTGAASKPISTGLYDYAINRMSLNDAAEKILINLQPKEKIDHVPLGDIGNKGSVFIAKRWRMYTDKDSRHDEFKIEPRITTLKEAKACIKKIKKYAYTNELDDMIDDFRNYNRSGIDRTSVFIGIKKFTTDNTYKPYGLSNGEKSIVLIQRKLRQNADAYLLDEPELSMSNSYIDEVIRPRIIELGKQKKTVLLATHNANLAVRTLPYTTIYRTHNNKGYQTYTGNPFTNKLIDILDNTNELDWKEVSMRVLEGGEEAFNDRGEIYESGRR